MNIVEKLKLENIDVEVECFEGIPYEIKEILRGKEIILSNYENANILSLEDYINYVFLSYIMQFQELHFTVEDNENAEFEKFINACKQIYDKYAVGDLVKYIQKDYTTIYNYKDYNNPLGFDLKTYTSDFIAEHFNSFDGKITTYVINKYTYNVIDSFEKWYKYFLKRPERLQILFSERNIDKVLNKRVQELVSIIEALYRNDKFKEQINNTLKIIYSILEKKYFNPKGEQDVVKSYYMLNDVLPLYKKLKSTYTYKIELELKKVEELRNANIIKNGGAQTFQVDLKPFKDFFEDNTKPWEIRIIFSTHYREGEGNLASFLEAGAKCKDRLLCDESARKNPGTDSYFTNWRLRNLELYILKAKSRFIVLMSTQDNVREYLSDIYGELRFICKSINTTMEAECLNENMDMLSQFLNDIFIESSISGKQCNRSIKNNIYGCAMFICGLIEKILRIIYKNSMYEISYIPDSIVTLGYLLKENKNDSSIILDILGAEQLKCLKYYLHNLDVNNLVGKNIRNDLAHINGKTMKKLNKNLILELLAYLTSVINSCVLYYQSRSKTNNIN